MKNINNNILSISIFFITVVVLFGTFSCLRNKEEEKKLGQIQSTISIANVNLKLEMRKVWTDHVVWTRNVILCLVDKLPGTEDAVERLLQNQVDIGNVFNPYYGEKVGDEISALLKEHINISAEVVNAAKDGNKRLLENANNRWYANSDELSEYFCKLNSAWDLTDMKKMMKEHLAITTNEAVQRIKMNYQEDIAAFDEINIQILMMADLFTDGIAKQFPEKF